MGNGKLKKIGDTFINGLTGAGRAAANFAVALHDNADKVLVTSMIAGSIAGSGVGFGMTYEMVAAADRKQQSEYEQIIDERTGRRNEFINAGASDEVIEVFDTQNPQPERPAERQVTSADRITMTSIGGVLGMGAGFGFGLVGLAAGTLGGVVADARAEEKKQRRQKRRESDLYNDIESRR